MVYWIFRFDFLALHMFCWSIAEYVCSLLQIGYWKNVRLFSFHIIYIFVIIGAWQPVTLYIFCRVLFQSNAQRMHRNHWGDKICGRKTSDIGYAPILFSIIILCIILFINSVVAGRKSIVFEYFMFSIGLLEIWDFNPDCILICHSSSQVDQSNCCSWTLVMDCCFFSCWFTYNVL